VLSSWCPDGGTRLRGSGSFRSVTQLDEVSHQGCVFLWLLSASLSLLPVFFCDMIPAKMFSLTMGPKIVESNDLRLKLLNLWTKINPLSV
jgi:hypothetical protein